MRIVRDALAGALITLLLSAPTLARPRPQEASEPPRTPSEPAGHGQGHDHGHRHGHGHGAYQHDFQDAEQWSKRFDEPERRTWQKPGDVVDLMELSAGMTVADVGAGTGYFLSHLSAAVGDEGRVLALDVEPDMIRFMTERTAKEGLTNVEAQQIPYDDPELAPGSVDRVLIVNTWHHIADRPEYAAKLLAALRPGGRVYIVDFTRDSPSGPPVEHRLEPDSVIGELQAGGFEAEVVEETLPRQYVVVGTRPPSSP